MSFGTQAVRTIEAKEWQADYINMPTWTRNANWLAMPVLPDSTQQINILYAVFDNASNYVAFTITGTGTTTVDWGDGSSNTYASGVQASHQYSFSDPDLTTTSEVYKQGMIVITNSGNITGFNSSTRPTGFTVANFPQNILDIQIITPSLTSLQFASTQVSTTCATRYPLCEHINLQKTTTSFNIANGFFNFPKLTQADFGPTVTLGTTGQLFFQCSSLLTVNGLVKSNTGGSLQMFAGCVSLVMAPSIGFTLGTGMTSTDTMFSGCVNLKYFPADFGNISGGVLSATNQMFSDCRSLEIAPFLNTSTVTTANNMFQNNTSLKVVPAYNFANVTTGNSIFTGCSALESIPAMNFSSVQNASGMFLNCAAIKVFPELNFSSATSFSTMFSGCRSMIQSPVITSSNTLLTNCSQMFSNCSNLKEFNPFATGAVTNMSQMFSGCNSIMSIPSITTTNTNALVSTTSMFSACNSLEEAPAMTTPALTSAGSMYVDCFNLMTTPLIDLNGVSDISSMFSNCVNLQSLPTYNMTTITTVNGICATCNNLQEIPAWNMSSITTIGATAFATLGALSRFRATGMNATFSVANGNLSGTALDEIYTNLSATGAGKTITVTGNWGTATDNPAIATAKGWTVTG